MASIFKTGRGGYAIQFAGLDGKRRTIRLATDDRDDAADVALHVRRIIAARATGAEIKPIQREWIESIANSLRRKLEAVGVIPPSALAANFTTLETFIDGYIRDHRGVKASTQVVYGHTRRCLLDFFGAGADVASITERGVENWRASLAEGDKDGKGKLSPNTIRRRTGIARQFFDAAVEDGLIARNPFRSKKFSVSVVENRSRDAVITAADTVRLMNAAPDAEWRLLIALARFAGLRVPSEVLGLTWGDINWESRRFTVRSPKTEHHAGGGARIVPIFPELVQPLHDVFDAAEEGAIHVITRYRNPAANLRTQFARIIARAGLRPWPKLWQNLRSNCVTDWYARFPPNVCADWAGHRVEVAMKHYAQTTEAHFAAASEGAANALQTVREIARNDSQQDDRQSDVTAFIEALQRIASSCDPLQCESMGVAGLEPATSRV